MMPRRMLQAPGHRYLRRSRAPPRGSDILIDLLAEAEVARNAARFMAGIRANGQPPTLGDSPREGRD